MTDTNSQAREAREPPGRTKNGKPQTPLCQKVQSTINKGHPVHIPWPQPHLGSQEPERTRPLTQAKGKHVPSSSSKPSNSPGEGRLSKRGPDTGVQLPN